MFAEICLASFLAVANPTGVGSNVSLGSDKVAVASDEPVRLPDCEDATLVINHDRSFENAYCWQLAGSAPPYYGCFGEAYDLGPGYLACGAFWISQLGYYMWEPADVFVWAGGVSSQPAEVLAVVPDVIWLYAGHWPLASQNDVVIGLGVLAEFTVGFWSDTSDDVCTFFCPADCNGPGGYPWTCIAPGQQWPSGWQDPSIVWGSTRSLGIGVYFSVEPSCVEGFADHDRPPLIPPTWGEIKEMFGR